MTDILFDTNEQRDLDEIVKSGDRVHLQVYLASLRTNAQREAAVLAFDKKNPVEKNA